MPELMAQAKVLATPASTFDPQASGYDARVGLPESVSAAVAREIVDLANAGADDLILELGAGTGEIGAHLARQPVRYVGLDSSRAMLDLFRAKANGTLPSLIVADCNQLWPLPDGSATVIFASRVIHLLDPAHVVGEAMRVCRPAGFLILGRVLREPDSIKERLRRRRQELLIEAGISPRQGEAGARHVIERCVKAGGAFLGRHVAAEWSGETTPAAIIVGWASLSRMGAVRVDPVTRAEILAELQDWARIEIGDLNWSRPFRERYAIDIVRLP